MFFRERFDPDLCFSVQLNEILKQEWSIDDELVPRIEKHEDAQHGNDRENDQISTSK